MSVSHNDEKEMHFLGKKRAEPNELKESSECLIQTGDKVFKLKCTVIRNTMNSGINENIEFESGSDGIANNETNINLISTSGSKESEPKEKNTEKESLNINENNIPKSPKEIIHSQESKYDTRSNISKLELIKNDSMFTNYSNETSRAKSELSPIKKILNGNPLNGAHSVSTSIFNKEIKDENVNQSSDKDKPKSFVGFSNGGNLFTNIQTNQSSVFGTTNKNTNAFGSFLTGGSQTGNSFFSNIGKPNSDSDNTNLFKFSSSNNTNIKSDEKEKDDLFGNNQNLNKENIKKDTNSEDNSDDESEDANYEPDSTILFKENEKEISPYTKIFSKQINKLFEYNKAEKKYLSKGKGILSIEHMKVNNKNVVAIVYR